MNRAKRCEGFTLGELLVVIAIIALLAAILAPVLFRAREQGTQARCASNMRQLGQAFMLYVQDWNSYWPSPGGLVGNRNYWSQSAWGGLVPYIRSKGGIGTVWTCPLLKQWSGPYHARSYGMNSYMRNPPDIAYPSSINILKGMHDTMLENPRRTILLFEGIPILPAGMNELYYIYRCGDWTCVRGWFPQTMPKVHTIGSWQPWHGERNNYLYCDGHLQAKRPDHHPKHPPYDITNEWWVRKSAMAKKMGGW